MRSKTQNPQCFLEETYEISEEECFITGKPASFHINAMNYYIVEAIKSGISDNDDDKRRVKNGTRKFQASKIEFECSATTATTTTMVVRWSVVFAKCSYDSRW